MEKVSSSLAQQCPSLPSRTHLKSLKPFQALMLEVHQRALLCVFLYHDGMSEPS